MRKCYQSRQHRTFDQRGSGIISTAKKAKKFIDQYGNTVMDASNIIGNLLPSSDEKARNQFPGERHAILKLPNGKFGRANYMGPGTRLSERLKRGDPPRTYADKIAKAHDLRYSLAQSLADIRNADNKMVGSLRDAQRRNLDNNFNIRQGMLIKAKTTAEDLGLLKKDAFSGDLSTKKITKHEKKMLNSKLASLEQEGLGFERKIPSDDLKLKLLQKISREGVMGRGKKKGKKKGKGLKVAGHTGKGLKVAGHTGGGLGVTGKHAGSGLGVTGKHVGGALGHAGFKSALTKKHYARAVSHHIIPHLVKEVGLPQKLSKDKIHKVVMKGLSQLKSFDNLEKVSHHIANIILPIMNAHLPKSGKGLKYGAGLKNTLLKHLASGALKTLKWFIKTRATSSELASMDKVFTQMSGKGKSKQSGSGSWGRFWKGFKRGFRAVMKPASKVIAPVATLVGAPEVGAVAKVLGSL